MRKLLLVGLALLLTAGLASAQEAQTPAAICEQADVSEPETREYDQADWVLEDNVDYRAIFCTDAGPVYVDLFEDFAPITVNNFVFLAQNGFYNNTMFHRVIEEFMAQGGDPTGTGTGGPGYQFQDEFVGFLNFDRPGWLAMANANRPEQGIVGTNGSQFFITTVPTPHLDFRHTIFGEVLEGMENVNAIEIRDPATATEPGTALNTIVIIDDPAAVETTFEPEEQATQEEVVAAFEQISDLLPPEVEHTLVSQTTAEVVENAPAEVQDALGSFLEQNSHEYRVGSSISSCMIEQIPFMTVSYTLDAFASEEDAQAALSDTESITAWMEAEGLSEVSPRPTNLANPAYSASTSACDTEATRIVTHWPRGRFLVTAEAIVPADSPVPPELWLSEVVGLRLYEVILSDVLRRELR